MREHYLAPDTEVQPIDGLARAAEYAPSPYENLDSRWVIGAGFADTDGNMIDADYTMCWGSDIPIASSKTSRSTTAFENRESITMP